MELLQDDIYYIISIYNSLSIKYIQRYMQSLCFQLAFCIVNRSRQQLWKPDRLMSLVRLLHYRSTMTRCVLYQKLYNKLYSCTIHTYLHSNWDATIFKSNYFYYKFPKYRTHAHIRMHACMHTHTHIHACTHTHTYSLWCYFFPTQNNATQPLENRSTPP